MKLRVNPGEIPSGSASPPENHPRGGPGHPPCAPPALPGRGCSGHRSRARFAQAEGRSPGPEPAAAPGARCRGPVAAVFPGCSGEGGRGGSGEEPGTPVPSRPRPPPPTYRQHPPSWRGREGPAPAPGCRGERRGPGGGRPRSLGNSGGGWGGKKRDGKGREGGESPPRSRRVPHIGRCRGERRPRRPAVSSRRAKAQPGRGMQPAASRPLAAVLAWGAGFVHRAPRRITGEGSTKEARMLPTGSN